MRKDINTDTQLKTIAECIEANKPYNYSDEFYNISYTPTEEGYEFSCVYDGTPKRSEECKKALNEFDLYIDSLIAADIYTEIIESIEPGVLKDINNAFESNNTEMIKSALELLKKIVKVKVDNKINTLKSLL